ncbi:hypothetical protein MADRUGA_14 [Mycobacterium phage Madruga]|uniref:Uncharacterized protein n=1 Tax=Mycobacterium phage Madruga TaxID=1675552 RepID=A0A0K1LS56_9CAUD|nr:hypothetical protein MADRUGA_14 [Mycobacterium phage Madruga]
MQRTEYKVNIVKAHANGKYDIEWSYNWNGKKVTNRRRNVSGRRIRGLDG